MGNPFDQFDVAPAAGTPPGGGNPFDQFDAAANMPDQGALDAANRGLSNTLSFNLMDEAVAAGAATVLPVVKWLGGKDMGDTWGERYDRVLADQRRQDAAAAEQHPIATGIGQAGAIAATAPKAIAGLVGPVMRSATAGERLINAAVGAGKGAAGGAAYSAASGFGEGKGGFENRVKSAAAQVPMGALVGGAFGGAFGGASRMPVTAPSKVAAASDRSGVYVPQALASDDPRIQQAGGAAKSIPIFGTRITEAGKRTAAEFAGEKGRIAEEFGGGAAATPHSAGREARDALEDWVGPLTEGVLKREYNAVDALVSPTVKTPLQNTTFEAAAITARNKASGLGPGGAVNYIQQALAMPGGLTYHGIKDLRTHIGEMLKTPSLLPREIPEKELAQVYKGLTRDLRASTMNAGGLKARTAFDKANKHAADVATRRTELMQVLGVNPNKPASAEDIFAAIHRKAGSRAKADIETVEKIRKSMPPDVWDQVASGVVGELGRSDALGTVSLDKFFTHWNQISDAGKTALFGNKPALRAALDDLATIAGRGKEVAKWANPSGTAQHGAYITAGAALAQPWLWPKIAASALGAHLLTRALTRPATVRAMTAWGRVWNANQVKRLGGGGPAQHNVNALQFVSRRFASEIGLQFNLTAERVRQLALALQGQSDPATASPPQ